MFERFGASSGEFIVAIACIHVDAQDGDGVEAPVAMGETLCPSMCWSFWRLYDRHWAVVVLCERGSGALTVSTSVGRSVRFTRNCRLERTSVYLWRGRERTPRCSPVYWQLRMEDVCVRRRGKGGRVWRRACGVKLKCQMEEVGRHEGCLVWLLYMSTKNEVDYV